MIIFAHAGAPGILFQLRNFDVPLMVLVSGMSFGLSFKENESYVGYIWKRVKRLVFPVWIFLTIYFAVHFIIDPESNELNFITILTSYTLLSGIGYIWIIRVFLLVAIVSPFLFIWHKNTQSDSRYFFVLVSCLLLYEILRYFSLPYTQGGFWKLASEVVLYIIPFSIIFAVGLRMLRMNKVQLLILSFICFGILFFVGFCLFLQSGKVVSTQGFKYPPSIYYFSYALFVSSIIWIYCEQISFLFDSLRIKKIILFAANNSIWVYLWHIPFIKVVHTNFVIKYFIVFIAAIVFLITTNLQLASIDAEE